MTTFDLLVIGAGSGGVRAARMAAARGKRVGIIERQFLGGTCVNVGCIPKKLFYYAAHYACDFHDAAGFGWTVGQPHFDWATLVANKDSEIARLNRVYANLLHTAGVTLIEGEGRIISAHQVQVGEQRYVADRLLVAVGAKPWKPDIPGIELALTSDEFFSLPALPSSAVVVGGGYIAVELAGILQALGVSTTVVHRGDALLRSFDQEVASFLADEMHKKGVRLALNENVSRVEQKKKGIMVHLTSGQSHPADCVLFATGRKPALAGLGLENTAVRLKPTGHIAVNEQYQTDEPSIHAIGDVVGFKELTPVATAEAMWLVDHWYGDGTKSRPDYSLVASAVFSQPAIGTVGLTQAQAIARYGSDDVQVFRSEFRALRHTLSGNTERTLMKLIIQKSTDRVVGMHMAGQDAGEIIQGFAVAIQMGVTKAQLDTTIGIHPTAAEEFVTMRTPMA